MLLSMAHYTISFKDDVFVCLWRCHGLEDVSPDHGSLGSRFVSH